MDHLATQLGKTILQPDLILPQCFYIPDPVSAACFILKLAFTDAFSLIQAPIIYSVCVTTGC